MLGLAHCHWPHPSCQVPVQPTKFTAVYFFVSDSFFCLSPSLALSCNWAIVHASPISTITGSTQSTSHRDGCVMDAHPHKHGQWFLSLWIDVSLTSVQSRHQELQNVHCNLLPPLKLISWFDNWHLHHVRHFFLCQKFNTERHTTGLISSHLNRRVEQLREHGNLQICFEIGEARRQCGTVF